MSPKAYKVILRLVQIGLGAAILGWWLLLSTICSSPKQASGNHFITYNCHGAILFITPLQDYLLKWTIPACFVLIVFGQFIQKKVKAYQL